MRHPDPPGTTGVDAGLDGLAFNVNGALDWKLAHAATVARHDEDSTHLVS